MYKNSFKYLVVEKGKCDFPTCNAFDVVVTISDMEGRKSYCEECLKRFLDILYKAYPKNYSKYINNKKI